MRASEPDLHLLSACLRRPSELRAGKVLFPSQTNDEGALKLDWLNQSRLPANCVLFEIGVHGGAYGRVKVSETFK
jgi:hypothetical protein